MCLNGRAASRALPAAILLALTGLSSPPAAAHETGLAGIHEWRRERGLTCMSDHFHYGSGSGPTKVAAERAAVADWRGFTVLEYGDAWGSYQRAGSKNMKCGQDGGSWKCSVEARPCKR